MTRRYFIDSLGARGDGVAEGEGGQVYIPFALPGESVMAAPHGERAELSDVLDPSPMRISPACRHFGECGGCAVQHLEDGAYRAWKRERVVHALRTTGIDLPVAPLSPCAPKSRRRVTFSARYTEAGIVLGYNREMSHTIIDISECPVARPEIVAALDALRALARIIGATAKPFRMTVTATRVGLDVAVQGCAPLSEKVRNQICDFTLRAGFARLSVDGEIVLAPRVPVVFFGDTAVSPPPGAFLQAVAGAEETMVGLVARHLAGAKRIIDLFSGAGAFALRLAKGAEIHAAEADGAALAALDAGFRRGTGLKRVTTERRDLFVRPVNAKELARFDGLVFDPPRAGARDQAAQIAKSDVRLVAAVSCNPATLARDLRILIDGGYVLEAVTPIDQFLWSPHVEAVALLTKPKKRR